MKWREGRSSAWLLHQEEINPQRWIYAIKRPEGYDYKTLGFPWGHLYIQSAQDGVVSEIIEHFCFMDCSPLEMECVAIAMREKYKQE